MLGWPEVLVIGGAVLLFFGPKRMPEMARSLGQGIKEFRKATQEGLEALSDASAAGPKNCSHCNTALKDDAAKFCPQCGKGLQPAPSA